MSKKQFSDTDAGAIIQRATELHAQAGVGTHLSLEDVEHIAAEMGVPAEHVRAAAQELRAESSAAASRSEFLAIPPMRSVTTLEGPVDDERWAHIVQILRRHLGGAGETETIGNVRYWNRAILDMGSEISRNDASVTSDGDTAILEIARTGVPVYRVLLQIASVIAGGGFFALLLSVGDVGPLVGVTGMLAGAALGLAGMRTALAAWSRRQRRRLSELGQHIAELTRPDPAGSLAESTQMDTKQPEQHDLLDGIDPDPEIEEHDATRTRERG